MEIPQSPWTAHACAQSSSCYKCFLMSSWHLVCFSLCLLPLVLWLGTTEDSLAQSSLQPPFRFIGINKILLMPCLLWLSSPMSLFFPCRGDASVPSWSSWPFTGLYSVWPYLSCTGHCSSCGKNLLPWCAGSTLPDAGYCTFLWSKGTVQVSTRIPKFFVSRLLPWSSPQHVVVSGVVQVQNFAILLAELPDVPINRFFQPVRFARDSGMFHWPVITPSGFVSSANLLREHFAPSSTSSVEMLNKTEPVWISGVQWLSVLISN